MKVVILAGGLGTRISEYTKTIPKPMIKINNKPIIYHIMKHYSNYGFKDFYIAAGYKKKIIKDYFKKKFYDWKVNVIDTGQKTMTGGRLKRLKKFFKDETFLLTYGDGLSNINLTKLLNFHKKNKSMVTMTAVRPPARFGAIKIKGCRVTYFKEKSKMDEGWINGGFFVIESEFLKYIKSDNTFLEREPLEKITKSRKLSAFKHQGYWQCVDTIRDLERARKLLSK
ncbi:sugar phosphate nucleotidyltransferase [Pelagibacteraceae bacterium]|nr:sugar phosphate nucleotidyltransferase [Pelagibacteraceae bacterium]MDC0339977.1 sugar phosphate nucleotidyltransferase [Pelagibacteraceae bacterium]